jgi:hypothetical protein
MDPKQDKAKAIKRDARYIADYFDAKPEDNKPRTEGKRAEDSNKWSSENSSAEPYSGYSEPSKPTIYEEPKSYVSDPAASARPFTEYGENPSHERGPKKTWQKDREARIESILWEEDKKESGK